ncbi:hypothetical protein [Streptomyces sp. TS71-3]|uniref:hypothetical protein n=1 Tax=Streptomyces sp. TS71-3 TaxID=2733862 RepID=UPI001B1566C7|nr:hypothetical protein [Streptomyces sp. TS71-3]GHJ42011.1 hypothetical protein Sm713_76200 [Streptomyces sp. TS71-3]
MAAKPNPFHVLGLSAGADAASVVRTGQDLAVTAKAHEERALVEWAVAELTGRSQTRLRHELLEPPGADYLAERWDDFVRRYGAAALPRGALNAADTAPRAEDFDLLAVIRRLVEGELATPGEAGLPDVDVRPALERPPVPFVLPDEPPLEVRDVLFG